MYFCFLSKFLSVCDVTNGTAVDARKKLSASAHKKVKISQSYHKSEWPGRQGSVVVDTVSHTHLNLSFLDPVASSIVQQTHYSVDGQMKVLMWKRESERPGSGCFTSQSFKFRSEPFLHFLLLPYNHN